jgi:hypothetical protein
LGRRSQEAWCEGRVCRSTVGVRAVDSSFQELKKKGKRSRSSTVAGDGAVMSSNRGEMRSRSSGVEAFMILSMSVE